MISGWLEMIRIKDGFGWVSGIVSHEISALELPIASSGTLSLTGDALPA
jgi:hypothetical protein